MSDTARIRTKTSARHRRSFLISVVAMLTRITKNIVYQISPPSPRLPDCFIVYLNSEASTASTQTLLAILILVTVKI